VEIRTESGERTKFQSGDVLVFNPEKQCLLAYRGKSKLFWNKTGGCDKHTSAEIKGQESDEYLVPYISNGIAFMNLVFLIGAANGLQINISGYLALSLPSFLIGIQFV